MANNTLLASDNFANGSLAAGWSAVFGLSKGQVVSGSPNVVEPNTLSTIAGQIWTGLTWPDNQICEVKLGTWTNESGTQVDLLVRYSSTARNGYRVIVANDTVEFGTDTSGTFAQIGSTITGLTVASGDVWTVQASGATFSVYQNGKPVGSFADATYTSGNVGFFQFSSVNITHTQVAQWRGYSAVQQDGIWTKQGVVLPAISSELGTTNSGTQNPSIIFEGNAQILSGNVFKMWFCSGNNNLSYAESTDGKAWTRYSGNPIVTGVGPTPFVFEDGGTYYLFGSGTSANVTLYTSSNGVSWTSQGTVFTLASNVVGYFAVAGIVSGTWYALYTVINSPYSFPLPLRLATSTSGNGTSWTDYASNPVDTNFWGVIQPTLVGTTYYAWGQSVNTRAQESTKPGIDPGEGLRKQTTNFAEWTNPVKSAHHSQMCENVNGVDGGCYVSFPINVNGVAYLYYTAGFNDQIGASDVPYQICLATAPASIANIITANEDAAQQIATDAFPNSGNLSANWTVPTGASAPTVTSAGVVSPATLSANNVGVYIGASFGASQYSQIALKTLSGTAAQTVACPIVRASTAAQTWYQANIIAPAGSLDSVSCNIYKTVAGTSTQIGSASAIITPTLTDVFRLSVITGSDGFPVLSLYQNGYLVLQVQDYSNAITSGNPGFLLYQTTTLTNTQISAWSGGNANVIPPYGPVGIGWSPVDSRIAVPGFGPAANTGVADEQGNIIYSAQDPPYTGNSQTSDNSKIPPTDSRKAIPVDSRVSIPENSRVAPPFGEYPEP